jgi:hypothetical protein
MTTPLKFAICLLLTLPLLAQDKAAQKPEPATKPAITQPATQEKSLGEAAREAKQQPKTPASKVVSSDDPPAAKSGTEASTQERESIVQHFQEFASSHTQEEIRSELQSWMHTELLKLLGNKPSDASKSNDQLIKEAQKQSPEGDAARIEQLLQQVREAGLLDDASKQDTPAK